jgi:hypothetical protein
MKTFTIESRVIRWETVTVKANNRKEAIKKADQNESLKWKKTSEEERQLVHIG